MIDYVSKMDNVDLLYLCKQFSAKKIRKVFKNNSKSFHEISGGGFRAEKLSDEHIYRLVVKKKNTNFIKSLINNIIYSQIQNIENDYNKPDMDKYAKMSSLIDLLKNSLFNKRPYLYFKLTNSIFTTEEILMIEDEVQCEVFHKDSDEEDSSEKKKDPIDIEKYVLKTDVENIQKEWDEEKNEYEKEIFQLNTEILELNNKCDKLNTELSLANETLYNNSVELDEFHRLKAANVTVGDVMPETGYDYLSLCKIERKNETTTILRRLHDVHNNKISLYSDKPDIIYSNEKELPVGLFGFWSWKTSPNFRDPTKDYFESHLSDKYKPIKIFVFDDCKDISQVIAEIKKGVNENIDNCNAIFAMEECGNYKGLFCENKNLKYNGDSIFILDSVIKLPVFSFDKSCVLKHHNNLFYNKVTPGTPAEIVYFIDPFEFIKNLIVKRTSWSTLKSKSFTKNEYKKIKDYLSEIPTKELYDEISQKLECGEETSKKYVDQLLERATQYLDGKSIEEGVLSQVIKNNNELLASCMGELTEEWEIENSKKINQAKKELQEYEKEKQKTIDKKKESEDELIRLEKLIEENNKNLHEQEKLADSVERKVAERIAKARNNAADFIAEQSFLQYKISSDVNNNLNFIPGKSLDLDKIEYLESWEDVLGELEYELIEAGVSKKLAFDLATYLYSSYINRIPIILAGPFGKEIADAFSVSLVGKTAGHLICEGEYSYESVKQYLNMKNEIIAVSGIFNSEWIQHIDEVLACEENYCFGLIPFAEDLIIEPYSVANYAIPLITDVFIDKTPTCNFSGGVMLDQFKNFSSSSEPLIRVKDIKTFVPGIYVRNKVQKILSDAYLMWDNPSIRELLFVIYPFACLSGNIEKLREYMNEDRNSEKLSDYAISCIEALIGEI